MILKNFFLTTAVLALSALATTRPEGNVEMAARDPNIEIDGRDFDIADNAARALEHAPDIVGRQDCGRDASWDGQRCVCHRREWEFDERSRTCRPNCGRDASWDGRRCVCHRREWEFDERSRTCRPRHSGQ